MVATQTVVMILSQDYGHHQDMWFAPITRDEDGKPALGEFVQEEYDSRSGIFCDILPPPSPEAN